jgi:signal transduction histidine kinase
MKKLISRVGQAYFGPALELRVQLFNVLVIISACFCLMIAMVNAFAGIGLVGVLVDLAAAVFCLSLLFYASHSGRAKLCHIISIVGSFFILFPYLFFQMGGYKGGIPAFLVFAVVFTVFMLEGKTVLVVTGLELALYAGMYLYAYNNLASVTPFPDEKGFLVSNLMDLFIVSIALGATMYAQVKVYRRQQRELDAQNAVLAQINRAKTEFLANTSHEMRTPLTVISVNVQAVNGILQSMDGFETDPEVTELLTDAQEEIMRLSRMVSGMLTLASISEEAEKGKADLSALLGGIADILRLTLSKRGNVLKTEIEKGLTVFGNVDLLSQVAVNLIQNAHAHTENGIIYLKAVRDGAQIAVTVGDDGNGISVELLPHVFERGVTDKVNGGTGFGLFLCKTAVESHGGKISIASEEGNGTTVFFTLPVYQGQYGGDGI